jgi:hypothetical protein
MTAVAVRPGTAPTVRRLLLWAVLGAVVVGGVAGTALAPRRAPATGAGDSQAVAGYRADLDPIIEAGGSLVVHGLRPGLADIQNQAYPPDVLAGMADGWVATAERIREDLGGLRVPAGLEAAHRLYGRSLDGYVETARALRVAAGADGDEQTRALQRAATLGQAADDLYDRADAALTRAAGTVDESRPE